MLVFERIHAMIELTTKPVVSSPLGIFAEGVFRVFGNFEKRCLFVDDGSPIFTKPFSRDLMPGGTYDPRLPCTLL